MILVWRGIGVAVPILLAVSAGIVALFIDDSRLGNIHYTGWALVVGAILTTLPALATFGGEEKHGWATHSFFLLPVVLWIPILGVLGGVLLSKHRPASERIVGQWQLARCNQCSRELSGQLKGMQLDIAPGSVTVGRRTRTYEVTVDSYPKLTWRYDDDGSEESCCFFMTTPSRPRSLRPLGKVFVFFRLVRSKRTVTSPSSSVDSNRRRTGGS